MLKAVVIGCGRMGAEPASRLEGLVPEGWLPMSHAECLQQTKGVELVGLADIDTALLERHGRYYRVTELHTDYRSMLEKLRPEIVCIATRTPAKAEIVRQACAQGAKGIYVEKPLANSLAECKTMLATASNNETTLVYGVNRRYHAVYRQARELIQNNAIGEILEITVEFGRAQLLWAHPHSVDLMLFFLGSTRVMDIQAQLSEFDLSREAQLIVDSDPVVEGALFNFESGAVGRISKAGGLNVRIAGSRGTLVIHADGTSIQIDRPRDGQKTYFLDHSFLPKQNIRSATLIAFEEMLLTINHSRPPQIAPSEIESGLRMLVGCAWSQMQGGRPVAANEVPDNLIVTGKCRGLYA